MCTPEEMLWKKRRQVEKSEEMFVRPQQKKKKRERETWENSRQTKKQKQRVGNVTYHKGRGCHRVFKF